MIFPLLLPTVAVLRPRGGGGCSGWDVVAMGAALPALPLDEVTVRL